jgi:hypothetical protein
MFESLWKGVGQTCNCLGKREDILHLQIRNGQTLGDLIIGFVASARQRIVDGVFEYGKKTPRNTTRLGNEIIVKFCFLSPDGFLNGC